MSRPTVAAETALKHVVLYLKGTPDFGSLLGYNLSNKSKLSEIHGRADPEEITADLVEAFTDVDWAGKEATLSLFSDDLCEQPLGDWMVKDTEKYCPEQL